MRAVFHLIYVFASRLLPNVDGLSSPKSFPSTFALWVVHTSLIMTPCAHDARYFAGFEQSRASQIPSLTGSKYSSGFLLAIEHSPVHFAATRLGCPNQSGNLSDWLRLPARLPRTVASYPVCGIMSCGTGTVPHRRAGGRWVTRR